MTIVYIKVKQNYYNTQARGCAREVEVRWYGAGGSGGGGAMSPPARSCAREVEVRWYGAGGSGGGGALSSLAHGCAREVEVGVVMMKVVVVVVGPRHLRLAFARGR